MVFGLKLIYMPPTILTQLFNFWQFLAAEEKKEEKKEESEESDEDMGFGLFD